MSVCGCGRGTTGTMCTICKGTIERGFCGADFKPLTQREDGNWECEFCHQIYYAVAKSPKTETEKPYIPETTQQEILPVREDPIERGAEVPEDQIKTQGEKMATQKKAKLIYFQRPYHKKAKPEIPAEKTIEKNEAPAGVIFTGSIQKEELMGFIRDVVREEIVGALKGLLQ